VAVAGCTAEQGLRIEAPTVVRDGERRLVVAFRFASGTNVYWLQQAEPAGDVWLSGASRANPPPREPT
jgi:hypothetical protein